LPEIKRTDFFRFQINILETLLSPEWFRKPNRETHPAYHRWALCQRILSQHGAIHWPEQRNDVLTIATMGLDSSILTIASKGNPHSLKLGSMDFGDEGVRKKISSRVDDPEQFEDLMVELYIGAWHQLEKHRVEYREKTGFPDFSIGMKDVEIPTLVECKRARIISKNRMAKRIAKANEQISNEKSTIGPAYGIVVVDVTASDIAEAPDDELPAKLNPTIGLIQSCLKGEKNRSVGAAIVAWDEYKTSGTPPGNTWFGFRRRSVRVLHKNPLTPAPHNLRLFDAWKVEFKMHYTSRGQAEAQDRMQLLFEFD
jgi:hypothetical protein